MYQQSFHTANYRGNQPGHDNYLRSDSNQPQQHFGGSQVTSQYRGAQRAYQPVGYVQSAYDQSQQSRNQSFGQTSGSFSPSQYAPSQSFASSGYSQSSQYANPQSFHTANYRGNQAGHDQYLRSDASQPSSFGTSVAQSVNAFNAGYRTSTFNRF